MPNRANVVKESQQHRPLALSLSVHLCLSLSFLSRRRLSFNELRWWWPRGKLYVYALVQKRFSIGFAGLQLVAGNGSGHLGRVVRAAVRVSRSTDSSWASVISTVDIQCHTIKLVFIDELGHFCNSQRFPGPQGSAAPELFAAPVIELTLAAVS